MKLQNLMCLLLIVCMNVACSNSNNRSKYNSNRETIIVNCSNCDGTGYIVNVCHSCNGTGKVFKNGVRSTTRGKDCYSCGGSGKVVCSNCGGRGHKTCSACSGQGRHKCYACNGSGWLYLPDRTRCPRCSGSGTETCFKCEGSGQEYCCGQGTTYCKVCYGSGKYGTETITQPYTTEHVCSACGGNPRTKIRCYSCNGTGKIVK